MTYDAIKRVQRFENMGLLLPWRELAEEMEQDGSIQAATRKHQWILDEAVTMLYLWM